MKEGWMIQVGNDAPHYIRAHRPICVERFTYVGKLYAKPTATGCAKCWRILAKEQHIPLAPPPKPGTSSINHPSLRVTMRFNPIELASLDGICKFHAMSKRFLGDSPDEKQVASETRAICIRINDAYARAKQKLEQAFEKTRKANPTTPPLQHSTAPASAKAS